MIKSLQAVTSNQHPLGSACVAKVCGCKQQLAIELHKPVIRKLGKPKVYSSFKDYVSLIFTVNMHRFFLWKTKKGIMIGNNFQKSLDESKSGGRKPNQIWVDDECSEFYNRSMKSWLQDNDIEMYSTYKEGKFVLAERLIRTLKSEIYIYMTSTSKNLHIDKYRWINKYNNRYHSSIKIKLVDVKSIIYIDFGLENNDKDTKLMLVTM